jgi:prevent-host-death family protein
MRTRKHPIARRSITASEFKATCLALMDEVQNRGSEITITKHRRPVAKLVPATQTVHGAFIGRSPGVIHALGDRDLIAPVNPDWEVDADL